MSLPRHCLRSSTQRVKTPGTMNPSISMTTRWTAPASSSANRMNPMPDANVHVVFGFICILGLALMLGLLGWVTHDLSERIHPLERNHDESQNR